MQSKTTPTIDAMFYQAASIPLRNMPPLEYLLTRIPRQYPLFPMTAFNPSTKNASIQHFFRREQRTYTPYSPCAYSNPPKPTKPLSPTIQLLMDLHNAGFKGKDDTALFDFLASNLPASALEDLTDAWTDYFRQYAHPLASDFNTALLFILKLRAALDQSVSQFETTYADRLTTAFVSVGVTKCSLSWDRNTEYRTWSLTGAVSFIVRPHSKIPNAIHIQLPNLFTRSNTSLYEELVSPHQDQLLRQCEYLAYANGFTTY